MADSSSGAALRLEREAAELGQEAIARAMGVSVKTVQRLEKAPSVKKRDAAAYRAAIRQFATEVEADRPDNVLREPTSSYSADRRPLADILKGERALEWLLAFRREMRALAGTVTEDRAMDIVTNEANLELMLGDDWTEERVLAAMAALADGVRSLDERIRAKPGRPPMELPPGQPEPRSSAKRA